LFMFHCFFNRVCKLAFEWCNLTSSLLILLSVVGGRGLGFFFDRHCVFVIFSVNVLTASPVLICFFLLLQRFQLGIIVFIALSCSTLNSSHRLVDFFILSCATAHDICFLTNINFIL